MQNYTVAFLGVVPIENGQAIFACPFGKVSFQKTAPCRI